MEILIPTDAAWYVLNQKLSNPFVLYLFLKTQCSGKIRITNDLIKTAKALLKYQSERSIKNNLHKLLQLNFIGYNPKSGIYFIRGWDAIQDITGTLQRTASIYEDENFNNLKAFLFATVIQKELRRKRYRTAQLSSQNTRSKKRANQSGTLSPFSYSIRYIANILHISIYSCNKLKHDAMKAGFIEVVENWEPTAIDGRYINEMRKYEPGNRYKIINGVVHVRKADLIKSNVVIVKRRWKKNIQVL